MPSTYPAYDGFLVSFPAPNVAHVELNRPSKLNAISPPMWPLIRDIFTRLDADPNVRAVVVSGAGDKAFTAGLDVSEPLSVLADTQYVESAATSGPLAADAPRTDPARKAFELRKFILEIQGNVTPIETCSKPVIFAMHGYAYGAAIDLSSAADIRVCSADVKFCVKEIDIGLAADVGTLSRMPKLGCSMSWVKELAYTARVFGADEALRHGFVSHVAPDKAACVAKAMQLAKLIAEKSPVAVQGTKNLIDYSRDHSVADGLAYTAIWNGAMLQTEDVQKAMMSGVRRTKVSFAKL